MAGQPSLEMISKVVEKFPEPYRNDFTSQVQGFYEQYLSIMSAEQRREIDQFIERTNRNRERGQRASNTRRARERDLLLDEMKGSGTTLRQEIDFYNREEFTEAGIRRKFEGYNEEFIQARIRENNEKRAELQRQLR
jgi:hypothetical protein